MILSEVIFRQCFSDAPLFLRSRGMEEVGEPFVLKISEIHRTHCFIDLIDPGLIHEQRLDGLGDVVDPVSVELDPFGDNVAFLN